MAHARTPAGGPKTQLGKRECVATKTRKCADVGRRRRLFRISTKREYLNKQAGAPRMFDNLLTRILAKRDPIDPPHYQPLKATLAMFREGKQNVQLG